MTRLVAVTAASGRIGGHLARHLIERGLRVRAIGRDREKLAHLERLGAEIVVGDMTTPECMTRAFDGVDEAFLLVPGNQAVREPDFRAFFQRVGETFATAIEKARVPRALFVSTLGVHDEELGGFVMVHRDVERILARVEGCQVTNVRIPFFWENLFYFAHGLPQGVLSSPLEPGKSLEAVSTRDAAVLIADLIATERRDRPASVEVHGCETFTMADVGATLSEVMDRQIAVVQHGRDEDILGMRQAGIGDSFAQLINDTWEIYNRLDTLRQPGARDVVIASTGHHEFVRDVFVPALAR